MPQKSFDTYMAESGKQSELDKLRATGGYESAKAKYEGGSQIPSQALTTSTPSSTMPSGGIFDLAKQLYAMQQQFAQPAVQALQQGAESARGRISDIYGQRIGAVQAEAEPTRQRYQSLLESIKSNQKRAEERQTLGVSQTFGARGIPRESPLFQQELAKAVNPITEQYTGELTRTGLEGEAEQRNILNLIAQLTGQEAQAYGGLETGLGQSLAGLYGGASGNIIENALNLYKTQQEAELFPLQKQLLQSQLTSSRPLDIQGLYNEYLQSTGSTTQPQQQLSLGLPDFDKELLSGLVPQTPAAKFKQRVLSMRGVIPPGTVSYS